MCIRDSPEGEDFHGSPEKLGGNAGQGRGTVLQPCNCLLYTSGYGRYGSLVFQEFPVGTAATLPWDYQTQTAAGGDTRKEEEVNL